MMGKQNRDLKRKCHLILLIAGFVGLILCIEYQIIPLSCLYQQIS